MVILTADDYGKNRLTTDNILECGAQTRISCASAMVFMEDSERAASKANESGLEIGLHLNFTAPFTGNTASKTLLRHHKRIVSFLSMTAFSPILFNPFLVHSFKVVFRAQESEFNRLYGKQPDFYNGHHHMHLCTNVLLGNLLPAGARIRRSYTFNPGEKDFINIQYRKWLNKWISKRFISSDKFLSIEPVSDVKRLCSIFNLAKTEAIEIEVHPEIGEECRFLLGDQFSELLEKSRVGGFGLLRG